MALTISVSRLSKGGMIYFEIDSSWTLGVEVESNSNLDAGVQVQVKWRCVWECKLSRTLQYSKAIKNRLKS